MITTVGVFKTHEGADKAIQELHSFGVETSDMSYVYANVDGKIVDATADSKVNAGVGTGVATGTIIGAVAGLVVAEGILPGLGALIVAGPLAAALGFTSVAATAVAGAATGAATGGLIGALSHLGVSDTDTNLYEALIRKGEILVVANTEHLVTKDILAKAGAEEVREYVK